MATICVALSAATLSVLIDTTWSEVKAANWALEMPLICVLDRLAMSLVLNCAKSTVSSAASCVELKASTIDVLKLAACVEVKATN